MSEAPSEESQSAAKRRADGELFCYEARRDGRTVMILRGVAVEEGGVDVETEAYPLGQPAGEGAVRRLLTFPAFDKCTAFIEDMLASLESQNCIVTDR